MAAVENGCGSSSAPPLGDIGQGCYADMRCNAQLECDPTTKTCVKPGGGGVPVDGSSTAGEAGRDAATDGEASAAGSDGAAGTDVAAATGGTGGASGRDGAAGADGAAGDGGGDGPFAEAGTDTSDGGVEVVADAPSPDGVSDAGTDTDGDGGDGGDGG